MLRTVTKTLLIIAMFLSGFALAQDLTLSLNPDLVNANVGDIVTFKVLMNRNNPIGHAVAGFDLSIGYDPALAQLTSFSWGDTASTLDLFEPQGLASISSITTNLPGVVNFHRLSLAPTTTLDQSQPAKVTVASISFKVLANGQNSLSIASRSVSDSTGAALQCLFMGGFIVAPNPNAPVNPVRPPRPTRRS